MPITRVGLAEEGRTVLGGIPKPLDRLARRRRYPNGAPQPQVGGAEPG